MTQILIENADRTYDKNKLNKFAYVWYHKDMWTGYTTYKI